MSNSDSNDLPSMGFEETLGGMQRAGPPAAQAARQDAAWSMLETYRTPAGEPGSRIHNDWLGTHAWRAQLVPHWFMSDARRIGFVEPLASAVLRRGMAALNGTGVGLKSQRPSAVWRVPADADSISRFFEAHRTTFHMIFPENLGFAVHANEGDYAVYAGPEPFLRDALPADALGRDATEWLKTELEKEHGRGWLDGILAHYAPFMLDE